MTSRVQIVETVTLLVGLKLRFFWDNDSLSALLALELKADLLVLLSDVDGLYSGPPSDPQSRLIHTYIKEKHQSEITFGDKSRVGRGGMTAKVKASIHASEAGIPVIITSGYAAENITKVIQGQRIGTLFHKDAYKWAPVKEVDAREMAVAARNCSRRLQFNILILSLITSHALSSEERKQVLLKIADALEAHEKEIRIENEADVVAAQQEGYEKSLVARLDGLILEKTSSPLGVLLIVFESRPDALVQVTTEAIPDTVGGKFIGLVTSSWKLPTIIFQLDDVIDLVIPRGSNKLVSQIKSSTKIPVLGHADGICHVYVDKFANTEMARRIVLDAKIDYPAGCNAMETLLVHKDLVDKGWLNDIIVNLRTEGVTLYGGPKASSLLNIPQAHSLHHEYSLLACIVEIVDDLHAAIDHINLYGRHVTLYFGHTDSVVTQDQEVADVFLCQIDSAAVFHNASTRFSDGARFRLGAEVGIRTSRIHARGPVGVDGLLTTRWILKGSGQVVDGDKAKIHLTHHEERSD
ncbi:hypothetical protein TanjilG_15258 [Lupinus angustifolius]|uniref:Aspartate/glutamate/uridylate kinase domain-containing protein n=1 Tax=Lupinus angustifolius TaxID=3871 RepID=A0A394DGD4_LUPAN|nr:hypothetical protein TanjilG_15258 [Lupinus angustifolius]